MTRLIKDPVLACALGLVRITWMFCFAVTPLLVVAAAISLIDLDAMTRAALMSRDELSGYAYLFVGVAPLLLIWGWFLLILDRLIGTVARATPFVAENATRLATMGWLMIALASIAAVENALVYSMKIAGGFDALRLDPPGSVPLALTLFILARIFRVGAAMRDDLEGTI